MRIKLVLSKAIVAVSLVGSSAQATTFLTLTGPSGNYGDDEAVCAEVAMQPCSFTRSFQFITPAGFNVTSMDISSIASSNPLTNIDFSTVTFNGINFYSLAAGTSEFRNLLGQNMITGGTNILNVSGTTGGNASFTGNISFGAVPEPAAWMLIMIGMAGVGYSMRRKENLTLRVRYV